VLVDGTIRDRFENHLNPLTSLGGENRLRGYRTLAFVGPNYFATNFEVRSRPIEILSVQCGAAAFYDIGDAFASFKEMKLKQGVGAGLRLGFPQIQRSVFRVDFGFPLTPGVPQAETTIVAQFEQAFPVPRLAAPGLVQ
jgi:hemolysin activation/secretion protein